MRCRPTRSDLKRLQAELPVGDPCGGPAAGRREDFIFGGDSAPAPAAPDYSGIAAANEASAKYAKEAADNDLAFRKQVYADSKPGQDQLQTLATRIAGQQADIGDFNNAAARQQWGDYNQTYKPVERQTVMDAIGSQYLSDADRAKLAGVLSGTYTGSDTDKTLEIDRISRGASEGAAQQALMQTQAMANSAYAQQARQLSRLGGDPNKMASAAASIANQQTLAGVNAANTARDNIYNRGIGLRTGVANFGRNMPNTAGQAFGLATQAGSSAVGNQNTGFQSGLPYASFQSGATGGQIQAGQIGSQAALGLGNLYGNTYGSQLGYAAGMGNQQSSLAGIGSLLGGAAAFGKAAGIFSDRRLKSDIVPVGTDARTGLTIYEFSYHNDARRWRGLMADEVEKVVPDAVSYDARGYAMVNYARLGMQMTEVQHGVR